jgi:putative ABC transport system substrate-binding protein
VPRAANARYNWDEFRKGLRELGYIEGQNLTIETRFGERRSDRLDPIAKELVAAGVDIIVSVAGPVVQAARRQTATIPIVMAVSSDPLGTGTVASLARPGGNVTVLSFMSAELAGLRLAVLKEAVPAAARIAVLYNPNEPPTGQELREAKPLRGRSASRYCRSRRPTPMLSMRSFPERPCSGPTHSSRSLTPSHS